MATILQANVGKSTAVVHCILETALSRKVDLVLFQEPPTCKEDNIFRPRHPAYDLLWTSGRVMAARRNDSEWTFSSEDSFSKEAEGDVQVLSMRKRGEVIPKYRIVNAYFQKKGADGQFRPAV